MRTLLLLAAVLAACGKNEDKPVDTTVAIAPTRPAALSPADVRGTWNGESKIAGTDSVTSKWVVVSTSDSTGTLTYVGTRTPIPFTTKIDADSMVATSAAFVSPTAKKGAPKVTFRSVARIVDGKLVGKSLLKSAAKPDSVLSTRTFEATKAP